MPYGLDTYEFYIVHRFGLSGTEVLIVLVNCDARDG